MERNTDEQPPTQKAKKKTTRYFASNSESTALDKHKQFGSLKFGKSTGLREKRHVKGNLKKSKDTSKGSEQKVFTPYMGNSSLIWQRRMIDVFPGAAPVSEEKIRKYQRGNTGEEIMTQGRTRFSSNKFQQKESKLQLAARQAARAELLLQETPGFLQADEGETTQRVTQHEISKAVDITSAQKFFDLKLNDFGPYKVNYTRNGRFLLMGGAKGHVAAIDWVTKKLMCEINVMETVQDVKWLHQETMYAVAQRQWTYIYDNQGLELHCLKVLEEITKMEFLPYHFLLAAASSFGKLTYIDVSVGEKIAAIRTGLGRLNVMCQNPNNAVICLGHSSGTVSMWSPVSDRPLAKMLCHKAGVQALSIDKGGNYLATSGMDRKLKIWDLRTYKMLQSYNIGTGAGLLSFSQTDKLAVGVGNTVEVYQDCCRQTVKSPYMVHHQSSQISDLEFCPYEDVLGVGHSKGFSSLIIPGSGEANFDALEANPYQTKAQRKQAEVKMLLEKVQPDMIQLDTGAIGKVNMKTLEDNIAEKNKLLHLKPKSIDYDLKNKQRGRSKSGHLQNRKKGVQHEHKRKQIREIVELKKEMSEGTSQKPSGPSSSGSVLDRFRRKDD